MSGVNRAPEPVGLCESCAHVRTIRSERGSIFVMCRRSATDPRFARYPRLPVSICPGHELAKDGERERG